MAEALEADLFEHNVHNDQVRELERLKDESTAPTSLGRDEARGKFHYTIIISRHSSNTVGNI